MPAVLINSTSVLPSLRVLYRRPVENETAVGLLNRMGLFSHGVFRSFIDNAIECLGDRRTTNMVAQCLGVVSSILNSHYDSPNFVFSAALTAISFLPRELAFIGPSLPPQNY